MTKKSRSKLPDALEDEIFSPSLDLAIDYGEILVDDIIESDIISEIPLVKTVVGIAKTGLAIKDRYFVKKLLAFLKEVHTGEIDKQKLSKFQDDFKSNRKYRNKVLETIIFYNDRFVEVSKSRVLGQLFKNHILGNISWDEFRALSFCLNNLNPIGYRFLGRMEREGWVLKMNFEYELHSILITAGVGITNGTHFNANELGKKLFVYGIKTLYDESENSI